MSKTSFKCLYDLYKPIFTCIHHFWPRSINFTKPPSNKQNFSQMSTLFSALYIVLERNQFIYKPPSRWAEFLSNVKPIFSTIHQFWAKSNIFTNPPLDERHFSQMSLVPLRADFRYYPSFLIEINKFHRWAEFLSNDPSKSIFNSTEYPPLLTEINRFRRSPNK